MLGWYPLSGSSRRELSKTLLLDTHYHLDFLPAPTQDVFLRHIQEAGVNVVAQTLLPSNFKARDISVQNSPKKPPNFEMRAAMRTEMYSETSAPALWSLGFHPWFITGAKQATQELALFEKHLQTTHFIGEIGLDFSPRRLDQAPATLQLDTLRKLLGYVCQAATSQASKSPYVLSIHAVRSAAAVLDTLDELHIWERNIAVVFHWFSGTSQDLTRLLRSGGYLSVNQRMLDSRKGRSYITQVPLHRILLESDLPLNTRAGNFMSKSKEHDGMPPVNNPTFASAEATSLRLTLQQTLEILNQLRGDEFASVLTATQQKLYGVTSRPKSKDFLA